MHPGRCIPNSHLMIVRRGDKLVASAKEGNTRDFVVGTCLLDLEQLIALLRTPGPGEPGLARRGQGLPVGTKRQRLAPTTGQGQHFFARSHTPEPPAWLARAARWPGTAGAPDCEPVAIRTV